MGQDGILIFSPLWLFLLENIEDIKRDKKRYPFLLKDSASGRN
jgi:hypothetical protein